MKRLPEAHSSDKLFIGIVIALTVMGFLAFISASLGLFARDDINVTGLIAKQALFGVIGGGLAFLTTYWIPFRIWRKVALGLFLFSLVLTALVFVPGIGFGHGGASRWINLGITTFQPAELLKYATVLLTALLLTGWYKKHKGWRPWLTLVGVLGTTGLLLLLQPDTDSYAVIYIAVIVMTFAAARRYRELLGLLVIAVGGCLFILATRDYIRERVLTFLDPSRDPLGAGYQIQQSLVAIGSGGLTGRGFGQSVQKFGYLPEPISDSIFAVVSEEFGLIGSMVLLTLFLVFALRAFRIAKLAPDIFSQLLVVGIAAVILSQAFINIASMLGLMPLSGITLPFVSHGGSALFMVLGACGIIAHISRYTKKEPK